MVRIIHNNYITIAKAIGIILMVVGHSGCPDALYRFIYIFHMPLFFFCSGIFMKNMTDNEAITIFLKRRIIGLYIPFLKWSFFFLFLHNFLMLLGVYNSFYGFDGGSSYYSMKDIIQKGLFILFTMHDYEELLGGFWFIRALFVSSILIALFSFLMRRVIAYRHEVMCIIFFILTVLIRRCDSESVYSRDLSMGTFGAFFYLTGYIVMRYYQSRMNKIIIFVCCLILLASFLYFKSGVSMECGYNKVLPFSIGAVMGVMLVIIISTNIDAKWNLFKPVLYYIGNHTLEILALHFLSFRLVSYWLVSWYNIDFLHIAEHPVIKEYQLINNSWWWVVYSFVGICVPLLLNYAWFRFKKLIVR